MKKTAEVLAFSNTLMFAEGKKGQWEVLLWNEQRGTHTDGELL